MNNFCYYFEKTYVGKKFKNGKINAPKCFLDYWNIFHVFNEMIPNTNNCLEAFNLSPPEEFPPLKT